MAKGKSRPVRWAEAVAKGQEAHEELDELIGEINQELADGWQELVDKLQELIDTASEKLAPAREKAEEALSDLNELREEYEEWYDNMPQQLQDGATGEKLSEIVNQFDFDIDLDLELETPEIEQPEIRVDLSELENLLSEAESAELPLGFGKD